MGSPIERGFTAWRLALVVVMSLLGACARPVQPPAVPELPPPRPGDTRGAEIYDIDSRRSVVHVLVARGGPLARLGHNHVVSAGALAGRVWLHPELRRSGFELRVPVIELIVDDQAAREAVGGDFAAPLPASAKAATRENMLGPRVLDAERYPRIILSAASIDGTPADPRVVARIELRGVRRDVAAPVRVSMMPAKLVVEGELTIRQTDFGITPFSAALGAIEVQDELRVRFKLTARERT